MGAGKTIIGFIGLISGVLFGMMVLGLVMTAYSHGPAPPTGENTMLILFFLGGIAVTCILIARSGEMEDEPPAMNGYPSVPPVPTSPLEVLDRRYAMGEISKDQYFQMKQDIGGKLP